MNETAVGLAKAEPSTLIQAAVKRVRMCVDEAGGFSSRLSSMRARILGQHDEPEPPSDAPEPVRSDFDELNHQLDILGKIQGEISRQITELENV
jgi:hypothetical protein